MAICSVFLVILQLAIWLSAANAGLLLDVEGSGDNRMWTNGDLRLVGDGHTENDGRLEMFVVDDGWVQGEWGSVCGDRFSMKAAHVACRQLGYHSAFHWDYSINTEYGAANDSVPVVLSGLKCRNSFLLHTLRCKKTAVGVAANSNCEHSQDVAIYCNTQRTWDDPYKGQVRLVGNSSSSSPSFGRVEVRQSGQWGTVCNMYFGEAAADSVCRQLGYTGATFIGPAPIPGSGLIWVEEISCNNSKRCFSSCFKAHKPSHNCNHSQDVAVQCTFDLDKARSNPAGNRDKCRIKGFPVAVVVVTVCLALSGLLVLGFICAGFIVSAWYIRRKYSPPGRYYYDEL